MIELIAFDVAGGTPFTTVTLPYDQRQKSRLLVTLDNGEAAGVFLPRGTILRGGDQLLTREGSVVRVVAAAELTSTAYSNECLLLMRASYHLGNRHVPLQLEVSFVRYQHDHVLDEMVISLGLDVHREEVSFEPESGAYHRHRTQGDHRDH